MGVNDCDSLAVEGWQPESLKGLGDSRISSRELRKRRIDMGSERAFTHSPKEIGPEPGQ